MICIGKPKLSSRRDEFRLMQIILAIRSIDVKSRLREECHPKLSRLLGSTMRFFWVGMFDIMLLVQFHYYSNSNRFRVNLDSSQVSPITK